MKEHQDAQLLFIGDSITEGWEGGGKEVWQKYYEKRHAVGLGIGGDHHALRIAHETAQTQHLDPRAGLLPVKG